MTKMIIALLGLLSAISLTSCDKELIEYEQGDIKSASSKVGNGYMISRCS